MTETQLRSLDRLHGDIPDAFDDNDDYEQDILHGRAAADISHAGEQIMGDFGGRYPDTRTRKNRTQQQVDAFNAQLDRMTDAYLDFSLAIADEGLAASLRLRKTAACRKRERLWWWIFFRRLTKGLKMIGGDFYIVSACVRQGWMPCSAYFPNVMITIRALEVYRVTRLRCPRLGIQALCGLSATSTGLRRVRRWVCAGCPWARYAGLASQERVPSMLIQAGGEPHLKFPFMCTFDGNNSLSRFWSREREKSLANGTSVPGASKELNDNRVAPGDYYLPREDVNEFEKEGVSDVMKSFGGGFRG
ncbi:hypothetical protein B0H14DRAFT_3439924 [Mycena olivaceomarginata]|nr:hypothetical protein B0H14DRAFT_3439924 [Mycena olivaceomarginata]